MKMFSTLSTLFRGWAAFCLTVVFLAPPCFADANSQYYAQWESSNFAAQKAYEDGDYSRAETLYQTAIADARRLTYNGPEAISKYGLAKVYHAEKKLKEAEPLYKEALEVFDTDSRRRVAHLVSCIKDYARLLREEGKVTEAARLESRLKGSSRGASSTSIE